MNTYHVIISCLLVHCVRGLLVPMEQCDCTAAGTVRTLPPRSCVYLVLELTHQDNGNVVRFFDVASGTNPPNVPTVLAQKAKGSAFDVQFITGKQFNFPDFVWNGRTDFGYVPALPNNSRFIGSGNFIRPNDGGTCSNSFSVDDDWQLQYKGKVYMDSTNFLSDITNPIPLQNGSFAVFYYNSGGTSSLSVNLCAELGDEHFFSENYAFTQICVQYSDTNCMFENMYAFYFDHHFQPNMVQTTTTIWKGFLVAPSTDNYTISFVADESVSFYWTGLLKINNSVANPSVTLKMQQGIFYPFQVFLKNSNNIAFIKVFWKTATLTQQLIPWSAIKNSPCAGYPLDVPPYFCDSGTWIYQSPAVLTQVSVDEGQYISIQNLTVSTFLQVSGNLAVGSLTLGEYTVFIYNTTSPVLVSGCANLGGTLTLDLPDCMFLNFHRKLFGGLWYRLTNPDDPSSLEEFILMNYSCYSGNFTEITLNNTNEDECTKITPVADYGEKGTSIIFSITNICAPPSSFPLWAIAVLIILSVFLIFLIFGIVALKNEKMRKKIFPFRDTARERNSKMTRVDS